VTNAATTTSSVPCEAAATVEKTARVALALIWIYEGLVPKVLFVTQHELELVARSGLSWPTPRAVLGFVAACEVAGGLWLLSGRGTRAAAALCAALVVVVSILCAVVEPAVLYHPFGGLSKNLALLACAAAVYRLAPHKSSRRKPSRALFTTTKEVV
jgi:uncharacterized membrane protein YphA (DoxX/SURF4 family)